jgi:hypothetical protein
MTTVNQEQQGTIATLVPENKRMDFMPQFFGPKLMMRGEILVFSWLSKLSPDYCGGYWHFYTLSNGGFYMAPDIKRSLRLFVDGNYFNDDLSADAAGIVATLFALNQLAQESRSEQIISFYYQLIEFASSHPEACKIFRAID